MSQVVIKQFIDSLPVAFTTGDTRATDKADETGNVQKLQSFYRALTRGDFPEAVAAMADDIEMEIHVAPDFDFVCQARGREEILAAMRANFAKVEDQEPEIVSLVAQGDTVVIIAREKGKHRPTGTSYDVHWVQHYQFRDGKIARFLELSGPNTLAG